MPSRQPRLAPPAQNLIIRHGAIAALGLLLVGCGGSSDPESTPASTKRFNTAQAEANLYSQPSKATVSAVDADGILTQLTLEFVDGGTSTFRGQATRTTRFTVSGTVFVNPPAQVVAPTVVFHYAITAPFALKGASASGTVNIDVYDGYTLPPVSASVGSFGPLATVKTFADANATAAQSQYDLTWALQPDSADTAWYCSTQGNFTAASVPKGTRISICIRIDPDGKVLGWKYLTNDGATQRAYQ